MEYTLTDKKPTNIDVDFIFKIDTLDNHLEECISVIVPTLEVLPNFKHLYEPNVIQDYYDKLKRNYEAKLCAWKNRGELWQKK